ncbi:MAG: thiolase family protein [Promethearchaeota archaeon]
MADVVIVSACRTAIGTFGGSLLPFKARDLAAVVMKEALDRIKLSPDMLDDVIFGACLPRCDELNVTRVAALKAGIPIEIPAVTINRVCLSGMATVDMAYNQIKAGRGEIFLCGGTESMSTTPYVSFDTRWGARLQNKPLIDSLWQGLHAGADIVMGLTSENLAERHGITREEQDEVALRSHQNAERAIKNGYFKEEVVPIKIPQRKGEPKIFDTDEHVRIGLTMEQLARLPPAFKEGGTVTAGNASGINDAAAALVVMSSDKADELNLEPLAKIVDTAIAGVEPDYMGEGPVPATQKLFKKTKLDVGNIDLWEINEAFATVYINAERQLKFDRSIANVNGSGISLGHPVGCTGARMIVTMINELKRRGKKQGITTLCGGGGMGMSTLIEIV